MTQSYLKPENIEVGQVWEDNNRTVRQVFSIWRGDVTYGFVRLDTGEFGSCCTSTWRFVEDFAKKQRFDIKNIEGLLLNMSEGIIKVINRERIDKGLTPARAFVIPQYPTF